MPAIKKAIKKISDKQVILVLEDEKPLQDAIKMKLIKSGFEVVTAREVRQSLDLLRDLARVDVIWLDHYLMGKKNGLDFVVEIKKNAKWRKIPIFVVTNTFSADKVGTYLALGVKKFYIKANFRLEEIIKDVREILKKDK